MTQDIHSIIERLKELHTNAPGELRYWPTRYAGSTPFIEVEGERWATRLFRAVNDKGETKNCSLSNTEADRAIDYAKYMTEATNALPALLEYISHLEAALKPFILDADDIVPNLPDDTRYHRVAFGSKLTVGDMRRAKALIEEGK